MEDITMNHILVVEDDKNLNQIICIHLNNHGFQAHGSLNANEAYDELYGMNFDAILSDIMMPGIDGYEFVETIRKINQTIPILFMSARDDFTSKQKGFMAGIDDYMVKPLNLDELILRIHALLRRAKISSDKKIVIGQLSMDANEMSATLDGEDIPVTLREFNILFKLLSYPKKTFSRSQLMDEFWGIDSETSLRSVDVYITKLRDKFSACTDFKIVTVHGLGYKVILHE